MFKFSVYSSSCFKPKGQNSEENSRQKRFSVDKRRPCSSLYEASSYVTCGVLFTILVALLQEVGGHVLAVFYVQKYQIMQYRDGKANPRNLIILAFILPYKHGIQLLVNDINKNAESLTKGMQQTQNYQQIYLL